MIKLNELCELGTRQLTEVNGLKECMVIPIQAVWPKGRKDNESLGSLAHSVIQYTIADRFEECNPCLVQQTIYICDFIFASCAGHISFIADNLQKKCNKKHVSLRDITFIKKVTFCSGLLNLE